MNQSTRMACADRCTTTSDASRTDPHDTTTDSAAPTTPNIRQRQESNASDTPTSIVDKMTKVRLLIENTVIDISLHANISDAPKKIRNRNRHCLEGEPRLAVGKSLILKARNAPNVNKAQIAIATPNRDILERCLRKARSQASICE